MSHFVHLVSHAPHGSSLSLVTCHPCTCASLLEFTSLLFYFDLSFPVFFFSFHLLHCELYSELDKLIAMESLCYSANKGSDDAYDVSTSLTKPLADTRISTLTWITEFKEYLAQQSNKKTMLEDN